MTKSTINPSFYALGLAALVAFSHPVAAHAEAPKPGVINVSATGKASIAPDLAIMNLTVTREGETARKALSANTAAMTQVLQSMKSAGIAELDLQTSNFNIQPKYFYPKRRKDGTQDQPRIVGYFVNNSLTVRVRELKNLGEILDTAVTLGVNSGGNIQFTSDDPSAAIEEARKKAMANAIAKANTLTAAANVGLGRVLSISESRGAPPRPRALARAAKFDAAESAPVPIAAGENSYSITVNVQWEIQQ